MMKHIYTGFMQKTVAEPGRLENYLENLRASEKVSEDISAEEMRRVVREGELDLEMRPVASLRAMAHSLRALVSAYAEMKWTVLVATEGEFVTSDCPVCREYPETHTLPAGVINPDMVVYFPISTDRVLRLTHDEKKHERFRRLMQGGRSKEAMQLRERTPEVSYRYCPREDVHGIVSLIIQRANRWVFSPNENPLIPRQFHGECVNLRMDFEAEPTYSWLKSTTRIR